MVGALAALVLLGAITPEEADRIWLEVRDKPAAHWPRTMAEDIWVAAGAAGVGIGKVT